LDELPKTLDETYERMLLGIDEEKRTYAHRLFQCLVVSIRPLRVEELAEVFAILPNEESTPSFDTGWRPEDPEEFILSACSTLVAIVDVGGEDVVQFSHFSVREYLTSDRIADSERVSRFQILPKAAHTVLARACLSVLLQLDYTLDELTIMDFPLAYYAAEHWVDHARFEGVSSQIRDGLDILFDENKPHFAGWIWLYDIDRPWGPYDDSPYPMEPDAVPLYYAALCGFCGLELIERLLHAYPEDVNALGGYHGTPLLAALYHGYQSIALCILERGADVEPRGGLGQTALYVASGRGYDEVVRSLIDRNADLDAQCDDKDDWLEVNWTPLHVASKNGMLETAKVLLRHGAGINSQDNFGRSPLHIASRHQSNDFALLLLDQGANIDVLDTWGRTALHEASSKGQVTVVKLLLEYGANVDVPSKLGWTPLHSAAIGGDVGTVQLLLEHGAYASSRSGDLYTPLHWAALHGHLHVVEALLNYGADPHARTAERKTPLELALWNGTSRWQIVHLLSGYTGEGM